MDYRRIVFGPHAPNVACQDSVSAQSASWGDGGGGLGHADDGHEWREPDNKINLTELVINGGRQREAKALRGV